MIYTKAGGSYVVARENFGPRVAQIASVALLIDYIVTVAVQAAAGTAAITSLVPALAARANQRDHVGVVLLLAYGNLRGVREAGKAFAFPTYFFVAMAGLVIVIGVDPRGPRRPAAVRDRTCRGHVPGARPGHTRSSPARRSSCCSRRSPTAARRSPGSRRSPTGSARSSRRSGATPAGRLSIMSVHARLARRWASRTWPCETHAVAVRGRHADRDQPGGQGGVRRRRGIGHLGLRPGAGRDRAHPLHRREHAVHRLSRSWPASSPRTPSCRGS